MPISHEQSKLLNMFTVTTTLYPDCHWGKSLEGLCPLIKRYGRRRDKRTACDRSPCETALMMEKNSIFRLRTGSI